MIHYSIQFLPTIVSFYQVFYLSLAFYILDYMVKQGHLTANGLTAEDGADLPEAIRIQFFQIYISIRLSTVFIECTDAVKIMVVISDM